LEPGDLQEIQKISSPHPIMDLLSDHLEYASANSKGVTGNSTTANIKKEEHLRDGVICDGSSLPLDAEGRLPFFLIDAHEEPYEANPGTIYLFGKVCVHA
jgi:hypothetical protein